MKTLNQKGFTIVELLIVIVIIGILASLVIVGYNGIQVRAENAKTGNAIQIYRKALIQYAIDNGQYPLGTGQFCVGESYPSGQCWRNTWVVYPSATANTALKQYTGGSLPMPSLQTVTSGAAVYTGAIVITGSTSWSLDGVTPTNWLLYVVKGQSAQCPVGPVISSTGNPNFISTPSSVGYTFAIGTEGVQCYLPLPNPSTL